MNNVPVEAPTICIRPAFSAQCLLPGLLAVPIDIISQVGHLSNLDFQETSNDRTNQEAARPGVRLLRFA